MTVNKSIYIMIVIAYFCTGSIKAQQDSLNMFTVPELKIHQSEKDSNVVYGFNEVQNYVYISGDSIKVDPMKYKYAVSINDIQSLTLNNGNSFWRSAIAGSITGFIGGFILGTCLIGQKSDILGGVAGGLFLSLPIAALFGTIGNRIYHDVDFDLSGYPVNEKKALLIKILRDNRIGNEAKLR